MWNDFIKLRLDRVYKGAIEGNAEECLASKSLIAADAFAAPDPAKWTAPYNKYAPGWWEAFTRATKTRKRRLLPSFCSARGEAGDERTRGSFATAAGGPKVRIKSRFVYTHTTAHGRPITTALRSINIAHEKYNPDAPSVVPLARLSPRIAPRSNHLTIL